MNRRWLLACGAAETLGMATAAGVARAGENRQTWTAFLLVLAGGLVEGSALGGAQAAVLRGRLGSSGRAWVLLTVLVAGLGWAAGSAPATLSGDGGAAPALPLVLLGAAALGAVMGAVLGAAQALVLRRHARHPWRWVTANVAGWAAAMPVVFAGATTTGVGWAWPTVVGCGAVTGAAAGLVLGAVTGLWLDALDGLPAHHELVLRRRVRCADSVFGGLTALAVTGRRSGRVYRFPVMAAPLGDSSVVVVPGHPDHKTWWRNLTGPVPVALLVLDHGAWRVARARVLSPGSVEWSTARSAYVARWPRTRVRPGPLVVLDLTPATADVEGSTNEGDQGPADPGLGAVGGSLTRS